MTIIQAIILGIVQGIAEFLPISSSGHLILIPTLFGWDLQSLAFDVSLHFGTVLAVLIFFFNDWKVMISMLIKDVVFSSTLLRDKSLRNFHTESKQLLTIVVVIIPVAIAGYLFEKPIENVLRSPVVVATMLILVAIVMYVSDRYSEKVKHKNANPTFIDSLLISLSQVIALIPGTSRSGITIASGLFRNLTREASARFSFLLATPIILGAALLKLPDLLVSKEEPLSILFIGIATSFIAGILSIKFLINFVKKHNLNVFIVYRILLGLLILLTVL